MKTSSLFLTALIPLLFSQCSNKNLILPDCGCGSPVVVKYLEKANATVKKRGALSTAGDYYLLLDSLESDSKYFSSLIPCDSTVLSKADIQEGSKVKITGSVKHYCASKNIKVWASPIEITKVETITPIK